MADRIVDLTSDTATLPTEAMYSAMHSAEVGDDGFGRDPTVRRLEQVSAERMGQEAGLFVTSGTQGNLAALLAHTQRGDEIIVEQNAHIFTSENGGAAALAGLMIAGVPGVRGFPRPETVAAAIRQPWVSRPRSALLCIENTHTQAGGTVATPEQTAAVCDLAHERGLKVHLDGARIFNAAIALGIEARELARSADSVTFCLSKGLSAPAGSVLCGTAEFIAQARLYRRMLGGAMRQSGILAAAGLVALETMVDRLAEDHANARRLAEALAELPGIALDLASLQTNLVYVDVSPSGLSPMRFVELLDGQGVRALARGPRTIRLVTHRHVTAADVDHTSRVVRSVLASGRQVLAR